MSEEGLMSQKEFSYHLDSFMEYMRKMENGMSAQWDTFEKFQATVKQTSQDILTELSKNERLTELDSLIQGLKTQFNIETSTLQKQINELKEGRENLQKIRRDIEFTHKDALEHLRDLVKEFKIYAPEELVKRGALQALEMVREFKEAYEYITNIRKALKSGDFPSFEAVPLGINRDTWTTDINDAPQQWSQRAMSAIDRYDLKTMGDLASLERLDFLRMHGCGTGTLREIESVLNRYGLKLGMKKYELKETTCKK